MNDFFQDFFLEEKRESHEVQENLQGYVGSCFIKKYKTKNSLEFESEKKILLKLQKIKLENPSINWFPSLYWDNCEDILVLQHTGDRLHEKNIPASYKEQVTKILNDLELVKIYHGDICYSAIQNHNGQFKTEFTVKNDKIYLVDFGVCFFSENEFEKHKFISFKEYKKQIIETLNFIYESRAIPFLKIKIHETGIFIKFNRTFVKSKLKINFKNLLNENIEYKERWINEDIIHIIYADIKSTDLIEIYYKYNNENIKIFEQILKEIV